MSMVSTGKVIMSIESSYFDMFYTKCRYYQHGNYVISPRPNAEALFRVLSGGHCQLIELRIFEPTFSSLGQILDTTSPTPLSKRSFTEYSVITGFHMMTAKSKQVVYNAMTRKKSLSLALGFEPPHLPFLLPSRLMRQFTTSWQEAAIRILKSYRIE